MQKKLTKLSIITLIFLKNFIFNLHLIILKLIEKFPINLKINLLNISTFLKNTFRLLFYIYFCKKLIDIPIMTLKYLKD